MFLGHAIINLLFDVLVVVVPMPLVWKLRLPRRTKKELVLVFGVGVG